MRIPQPTTGDVIDLILADHRLMEDLLRALRDNRTDREAARDALASLVVAHACAEESEVYPQLVGREAIEEDDADHGRKEHAEGNTALLRLLELEELEGEPFDEAVEELATELAHHLGEEEQTILNPARDEVDERRRADLGAAFASARNALIGEDCGRVHHVRALVEAERPLLQE